MFRQISQGVSKLWTDIQTNKNTTLYICIYINKLYIYICAFTYIKMSTNNMVVMHLVLPVTLFQILVIETLVPKII